MATRKIDEDAKENLSDAELKAARSNPPGDTELSGAAPGAKAGAADDPGVYDKPQAQVKAEKDAAKRVDEVREIQYDAYLRNFGNVPRDVTETVHASPSGKGDPDSITIAQVGGEVLLVATAREMRFGHEEALGLQRAISKVTGTL